MMAPVDVITPDRDFSKYPFVVAPAYQLMDQNIIDRFTEYERNGGHLVLTCRSGQKDRRGHLPEMLWAQQIYPLVGARIPFYDLLPVGVNGQVTAGGKGYAWGSWGEMWNQMPARKCWRSMRISSNPRRTAAVTHKLGKGTVTYIGVDTLDGELERTLMHRVYESAGAAPENLDRNFIVNWRDGFWVATNFASKTESIPAAAGAQILVGKREVPPGGAAVWIER